MARDTDRKVVSEALRRSNGRWSQVWGIDLGKPQLVLIGTDGSELDITYSKKGRIVRVAHWQVVEGTNGCAHREPITTRKLDRVLQLIGPKA